LAGAPEGGKNVWALFRAGLAGADFMSNLGFGGIPNGDGGAGRGPPGGAGTRQRGAGGVRAGLKIFPGPKGGGGKGAQRALSPRRGGEKQARGGTQENLGPRAFSGGGCFWKKKPGRRGVFRIVYTKTPGGGGAGDGLGAVFVVVGSRGGESGLLGRTLVSGRKGGGRVEANMFFRFGGGQIWGPPRWSVTWGAGHRMIHVFYFWFLGAGGGAKGKGGARGPRGGGPGFFYVFVFLALNGVDGGKKGGPNRKKNRCRGGKGGLVGGRGGGRADPTKIFGIFFSLRF